MGDILHYRNEALGDRIAKARQYLGYSQDQVARFLGLNRPAISLMESGKRSVRALELEKLANLFGRSVDWLLGKGEPAEKDVIDHIDALALKVDFGPEDRAELLTFIGFLRERKRQRETGGTMIGAVLEAVKKADNPFGLEEGEYDSRDDLPTDPAPQSPVPSWETKK